MIEDFRKFELGRSRRLQAVGLTRLGFSDDDEADGSVNSHVQRSLSSPLPPMSAKESLFPGTIIREPKVFKRKLDHLFLH